jgi:N-acyl-D-amino-acid deacylase
MDYDIVIRGGMVADGSGAEPYAADVAIIGGKIVAVGPTLGGGSEEIDARGKLVTPGFVDVHTHYDGQATWEHTLAPSSNHGVTTVVMGNCGVGFAPCRPDHHEMVIKLMEGVEDIPDVVMSAGVPWGWETFPQYLDVLGSRSYDIDIAPQLPHSPLRVFVMGERGANLEPPTEADLAKMRQLTAEAVRAGALGVTTSRNLAHRFRSGELAPSVSTEEQELMALADGLRDAGTGVFQMIPNTDLDQVQEIKLMRRLVERSGRPLSFSLFQMPHKPGVWRDVLAEMQVANDAGQEIRGQVYPRPTGMLLGLDLSLNPFALNPSYKPLAELPLAKKVARLRDPELRARLLAEEPADPHPFFLSVVRQLDNLYPLGDPPNYNPSPADSIAERAKRAGRDPKELIYDTLLERDGREILYCPLGNCEDGKFDSAGALMKANNTILGLGDGGAHYGMICDASFPTYMLTQWTRDAAPGQGFSVGAAVRALSAAPAHAVGLCDRGMIRPGYKADVNIIDLARLHLHAPSTKRDLPAGGRRLSQKADGYEATLVAGKVTYRNGESTGALPGRLVRGGQQAAA